MPHVRSAMLVALVPIAGMVFAQEIPDSLAGFDAQFQKLFNAYQADDEREFKMFVEDFAIPPRWFPTVFGVDQGDVLAKQYAEEFSDFEAHLLRNFQSIESWKARYQIDGRAPTKITRPMRKAGATNWRTTRRKD